MTHVAETIRDFCKGMGIMDVQLKQPDSLTLNIQNTGRLSIEPDTTGDAVYLSLARPLNYLTEEEAKAMLAAAHYRRRQPWPLAAAMGKSDEVAFIVRLPVQDFTVQVAYEILKFLRQQHEEIRPR
jgi:type III secretion system chaperone SycN